MADRIIKIGLAVVVVIATVIIFFTQGMIFHSTDMPPMSLLPAYIFLSFWDALAFGVGIALLIYLALNYSKWPREIRGSLLVLFFIALWFSILNWIHDGAHMSGAAPPNFAYLAVVEYIFHAPWLIFAISLVLVTRKLIRTYSKQA